MRVSDLLEQLCNKSDNAIKLVASCWKKLLETCITLNETDLLQGCSYKIDTVVIKQYCHDLVL